MGITALTCNHFSGQRPKTFRWFLRLSSRKTSADHTGQAKGKLPALSPELGNTPGLPAFRLLDSGQDDSVFSTEQFSNGLLGFS